MKFMAHGGTRVVSAVAIDCLLKKRCNELMLEKLTPNV
jgi:hypothetical protein